MQENLYFNRSRDRGQENSLYFIRSRGSGQENSLYFNRSKGREQENLYFYRSRDRGQENLYFYQSRGRRQETEQGQGAGQLFISSFFRTFRVREINSSSIRSHRLQIWIWVQENFYLLFFFWQHFLSLRPDRFRSSVRLYKFRNNVWLQENVLSARFFRVQEHFYPFVLPGLGAGLGFSRTFYLLVLSGTGEKLCSLNHSVPLGLGTWFGVRRTFNLIVLPSSGPWFRRTTFHPFHSSCQVQKHSSIEKFSV